MNGNTFDWRLCSTEQMLTLETSVAFNEVRFNMYICMNSVNSKLHE